jgi:hypothetical protein
LDDHRFRVKVDSQIDSFEEDRILRVIVLNVLRQVSFKTSAQLQNIPVVFLETCQ